jgi:hypothetical protein
MWIIGCDFHPSFQVVAIFDNQSSEIKVRRLQHRKEAEQVLSLRSAGSKHGGPGSVRVHAVVSL